MSWLLIGIAILAVIAFILLFKILKSVMKAMFTAIIIGVILLGITGIIIYIDANNVSNIMQSEKTLMLEYENEIISAAEFGKGKTSAIYQEGLFTTKTDEELNEINKKYQDKEYENITNNSALIFSYDYIRQDEITILGETITEPQIKQILTGQDLIILDNENSKALISMKLIVDSITETKTQELLKAIKDEKIIIRPELLSMTIIRNSPDFIINLFS